MDEELKRIMKQELELPESYTKVIQNALNQKEKKQNKKIFSKVLTRVAVVVIVGIIGVISPNLYAAIKWNIEYQKFENRPVQYVYPKVKEAVDQGYEENIEMEYVYQGGVGVKLNTLMLTDDYFSMKLDIIFDKDIEINTETFGYGYAVYDEEKNIYGVWERGVNNKYQNYIKKLCTQENIMIGKDLRLIADSLGGANILSSMQGKLITQNNMTSVSGFPKSKKLYIRIFDLGYTMKMQDGKGKTIKEENIPLTKGEWVLEVNVPEKFYQRENISYTLAEEIPNFTLRKMHLTETGFILDAEMQSFTDFLMHGKDKEGQEFEKELQQNLYLIDEQERRYLPSRSLGTSYQGGFKATFEISKTDLPQKLYLHIQNYTVELVPDDTKS